MKWVLVFIVLTTDEVMLAEVGTYDSMDACFNDRDMVIEKVGRPIINYQAVCVAKAKPYLDEEKK